MILRYYRVYDHTDREILADGIDNLALAHETLMLLMRSYPDNELELETYTYNGS